MLKNNLNLAKIAWRLSSRIEGLSTNLSVLGKSKGSAAIELSCIDLIRHPSADVALFQYDKMYSRVQDRR